MPRNRIIAILTVATGALCLAVGASAKEPDYPCYIRTVTGQTLNLGSLCGDKTAPNPVITASQKPLSRQKPVIEFAAFGVDADGKGVSGTISNLSDKVIVIDEIAAVSRDGIPVSIGFVDQVIEAGETVVVKGAVLVAAADVQGSFRDVRYWVDSKGVHHANGFTVCAAAASVGCKSH
ncbi:MAG: hypothetical protein ACAF41_12570 [Leptolyngbya sp. BL-A-14]